MHFTKCWISNNGVGLTWWRRKNYVQSAPWCWRYMFLIGWISLIWSPNASLASEWYNTYTSLCESAGWKNLKMTTFRRLSTNFPNDPRTVKSLRMKTKSWFWTGICLMHHYNISGAFCNNFVMHQGIEFTDRQTYRQNSLFQCHVSIQQNIVHI